MRTARLWGNVVVVMLAWALTAPARAQDVSVDLVKGTVRGFIQGVGTARVVASVTNESDRPLTGVTVRVYYSMLDFAFGEPDEKEWKYHKFSFRPALAPGKSKTVKFVDEDGASHVLLEVAKSQFAPYQPTAWVGGAEVSSFMYRDKLYVSASDTVKACGGTIQTGSKKGQYILALRGRKVSIASGGKQKSVGLTAMERNGRNYVPLSSLCAKLGTVVSHEQEGNKYRIYAPEALPTASVQSAPVPAAGPAGPEPMWMSDTEVAGRAPMEDSEIHLRGPLLPSGNEDARTLLVTSLREPRGDWVELSSPRPKQVHFLESTKYIVTDGGEGDASSLANATHIEVVGEDTGVGQPIDARIVVAHVSKEE